MQENISVLIATIMAVIIVVIFPVYNIATRQDSMANTIVVKSTTNFVDEVRNKGYLTEEDYNQFKREIEKTGNRYEIELEVYEPILIEKEAEEYEEEYKIKYTEDILKEIGINDTNGAETDEIASKNSIIKDNVSYLDVDYKFYVRVKNTNMTQAQVLLEKILGGESENRIVVNYGGIVYANNWEKGEILESANANISISRPKDINGEEYKIDEIEQLGIYGIAVRLDDKIKDSGVVKFTLKYKEIQGFRDEERKEISVENNNEAKLAREAHINNCIDRDITIGDIDVSIENIAVEEKSREENANGTLNFEYEITLKDIRYAYDEISYVESALIIKAGSAYTNSGDLAMLKSKTFILFYETDKPIVTIQTNPDIVSRFILNSRDAKQEMKITINARINSSIAEIDKMIFIITKNNVEIKRVTITKENGETQKFASGQGEIYSLSKIIDEKLGIGKYKFTAYAIDTRGEKSNVVTKEFEIRAKEIKYIEGSEQVKTYTLSKLERGKVNSLEIPKYDEDYIIKSYKIKVYLPYHTNVNDWYNIVNTSDGKNDIIMPEVATKTKKILNTFRQAYMMTNNFGMKSSQDTDYYYYETVEGLPVIVTDDEDGGVGAIRLGGHVGTENYKTVFVIKDGIEEFHEKHGFHISISHVRNDTYGRIYYYGCQTEIEWSDYTSQGLTSLKFNYRLCPESDMLLKRGRAEYKGKDYYKAKNDPFSSYYYNDLVVYHRAKAYDASYIQCEVTYQKTEEVIY